ncbi:MAG: glutamate racemase [Candidatus Nomurabacteria bacterium]|nr:glutamate racemase [Candidatus Nomurabacteria bacterium]
MKIGIFDSGVGGLLIAKSIRKTLPQYDYVYLGDTKRVPYGNRSHETILEFTREAVKYLFEKENCGLIIIACNTASAQALHELQIEYKNKKILGVIIPVAEESINFKKIGILATSATVSSNTFPREIKEVNKNAKVFQNPAPMLVPLAESGENKNALPFIKEYLKPLLAKKIDALILGCTHYPIYKKEIKKILPKNIKIISQDEIIPKKLKNYLQRHTEVENKLSKNGKAKILVTDKTKNIEFLAHKWFGKESLSLIEI